MCQKCVATRSSNCQIENCCADAYILTLANEIIEFSSYLRQSCERLGMPYYDVSVNFEAAFGQALESLTGKPVSEGAPKTIDGDGVRPVEYKGMLFCHKGTMKT